MRLARQHTSPAVSELSRRLRERIDTGPRRVAEVLEHSEEVRLRKAADKIHGLAPSDSASRR
jgi:hypothetical protein